MLVNILGFILLCLCLIEYNKCENFSKFSSHFNNEQNNKYSNNVVTFTTPTASHISSNSFRTKNTQNISNISNTHTEVNNNDTDNTNSCSVKLSINTRLGVLIGTIFCILGIFLYIDKIKNKK